MNMADFFCEQFSGLTLPDDIPEVQDNEVTMHDFTELLLDDCGYICPPNDPIILQIQSELSFDPSTDYTDYWSLDDSQSSTLSTRLLLDENDDDLAEASTSTHTLTLNGTNAPIERCATESPGTSSRVTRAVGVRRGAVRKVPAKRRVQRPSAPRTQRHAATTRAGGSKPQGSKPQGKPIQSARRCARALAVFFQQIPMPAGVGRGGNNLHKRKLNEIFTTALGDDKFIKHLWEKFQDGLWGVALSGVPCMHHMLYIYIYIYARHASHALGMRASLGTKSAPGHNAHISHGGWP